MIRWMLLGFLGIMIILMLPTPLGAEQPYLPFTPYHTEPLNKVLYPRLGSPVFRVPGSSFEIYTVDVGRVDSISIFDDVYGYGYELELLSSRRITDARSDTAIRNIFVYEVRIPSDITEGLYDIIISSESGTYREPNGLMVLDNYRDTIIIGHMSDSHIGGWGGKYFEAYEYFTRAIYLMEAIRVDIIVNSGDFIERDTEEGVMFIYNLLSKLTIPFTVTLGNADYSLATKGNYLIEKYIAPDSSVVDLGIGIIVNLNAETGDIAEDYVYEWVIDTMEHFNEYRLKIFNSHYPHWDRGSVSERFIEFFRDLNSNYGVSAYLHGHFHINDVRVSEDTGILAITVTSTEITRDVLGFRLVIANRDGSIDASDSLIYNVEETYVKYYQENIHRSPGQTVRVSNGRDSDLSLRLLFKLRDEGDEILVNGSIFEGEVIKLEDGGGSITLLLDLTLEPDESITYIIVQGSDDEPPVIDDLRIDTFKTYYYMELFVSDDESGVMDIKVYYSMDNSTWTESEWVIIDSWPRPTAPRDLPGFYYKIVLRDFNGNEGIYYGVYGSPGVEEEAVGAPIGVDPILIGAVAVAILALILFLWFRYRR